MIYTTSSIKYHNGQVKVYLAPISPTNYNSTGAQLPCRQYTSYMYLASICLLPPHPQQRWYGLESQKGVIPYALMHFHAS